MAWLALDIGGANLKAADGRGFAASVSFPLWKEPEKLGETLAALIKRSPRSEQIAATMTGELADCFTTKSEGVRHIIKALGSSSGGRPIAIYLVDGRLAAPDVAAASPLLAAASNWHVLARFAARVAGTNAALIMDIGTTTTDIIPIVGGLPAAVGATDPERLMSGELVYTGVERSAVCAVAKAIPFHGGRCPLAQELFATMLDVYLTLGEIADGADNTYTADGRPATREFARDRLARAICADRDLFTYDDARCAAESLARAQREAIAAALQNVLDRMPAQPQTIVISGRGEFLAGRIVADALPGVPIVSLAEKLGPEVSRCAAAHALAVVASEPL